MNLDIVWNLRLVPSTNRSSFNVFCDQAERQSVRHESENRDLFGTAPGSYLLKKRGHAGLPPLSLSLFRLPPFLSICLTNVTLLFVGREVDVVQLAYKPVLSENDSPASVGLPALDIKVKSPFESCVRRARGADLFYLA